MIVVVHPLLSMVGWGIGSGTVDVNAGSTPDAGSLGVGAAQHGPATGAGLLSAIAAAIDGSLAAKRVFR